MIETEKLIKVCLGEKKKKEQPNTCKGKGKLCRKSGREKAVCKSEYFSQLITTDTWPSAIHKDLDVQECPLRPENGCQAEATLDTEHRGLAFWGGERKQDEENTDAASSKHCKSPRAEGTRVLSPGATNTACCLYTQERLS